MTVKKRRCQLRRKLAKERYATADGQMHGGGRAKRFKWKGERNVRKDQ